VSARIVLLRHLPTTHCDFTRIARLPVAAVGVGGLSAHLCEFRSIHCRSSVLASKKKVRRPPLFLGGVRSSRKIGRSHPGS
jgi:hypothetical protein